MTSFTILVFLHIYRKIAVNPCQCSLVLTAAFYYRQKHLHASTTIPKAALTRLILTHTTCTHTRTQATSH